MATPAILKGQTGNWVNMIFINLVFSAFIVFALFNKALAIRSCYKIKNFGRLKAEVAFFALMLMLSVGIICALNDVFTSLV